MKNNNNYHCLELCKMTNHNPEQWHQCTTTINPIDIPKTGYQLIPVLKKKHIQVKSLVLYIKTTVLHWTRSPSFLTNTYQWGEKVLILSEKILSGDCSSNFAGIFSGRRLRIGVYMHEITFLEVEQSGLSNFDG